MSTISAIYGQEILDSRGWPTTEACVVLACGLSAYASVPAGASTGCREAVVKYDEDQTRYAGRGVKKAVAHIDKVIAPALKGLSPHDQKHIDATLLALEGTPDKSRLGANALLAVSWAVAKVAAKAQGRPLYQHIAQLYGLPLSDCALPLPMMNILNGGAHANNNLDIQEFMIVPVGASTFSQALEWGAKVYQSLKQQLAEQGLSTAVGDEGGFTPSLATDKAALDLLMQAVEYAGYVPGEQIGFALDIAASELFREGRYHMRGHGPLDSDAWMGVLLDTIKAYPVLSLEDPLAEDDWSAWSRWTPRLSEAYQCVGDDIFVTQSQWLRRGGQQGAANAILIKPNQVGTVTETLDTLHTAQSLNYACVVSHRSGETEDASIAELCVGASNSATQFKSGALCRTDRVAKYNQMLRIEAQAVRQGKPLLYWGKAALKQRTN